MNKFLHIILILLATTVSAHAGDPAKQIMSNVFPDGIMAYIKPRKMPKADNSAAVKPLDYDITLTSISDTILVAATVITQSHVLKADSVVVCDSLAYPLEYIYSKPKSNTWINRVRFAIPENKFAQTFGHDGSVSLKYGNCSFLLPPKKQKKEAEVCRLALEIISSNQR